MRACEKFGPSGENLGSNPHFGAIWAFFGQWKAYFLRAQLVPGHFFVSLCCAVVISLAAYTHSIKSSDNNSRFLSAGFAECSAYFSHETGLLTPKHLQNFRCAGLRGGGASHPAAALSPTLAVTITPVTFASAVAAPGLSRPGNAHPVSPRDHSQLAALGKQQPCG